MMCSDDGCRLVQTMLWRFGGLLDYGLVGVT